MRLVFFSGAVPHFEKMLYDQGQLANVYLDGFIITKDVMYSYVARGVLDYLRRDMIAPEGGIYSAEDADSFEFEGAKRKKEGAFYIWTNDEVVLCSYVHLGMGILTEFQTELTKIWN